MDNTVNLLARAVVGWVGSRESYREAPLAELRTQGFQTMWAQDIGSLAAIGRHAPLDLIVVDLDGTKIESYRLVQRIRHVRPTRDLPILFLSSVVNENLGVPQALQAGADDFLAKPVTSELLAARMDALLSTRQQFEKPEVWTRHVLRTRDGRIILNLKNFQCQAQIGLEYEEKILTRKEFQVLVLLLKKPNQLVRWSDFYGKGWQPHKLKAQSRTLVQHVMRLRQKLGPLGRRIETMSGLGYRWKD